MVPRELANRRTRKRAPPFASQWESRAARWFYPRTQSEHARRSGHRGRGRNGTVGRPAREGAGCRFREVPEVPGSSRLSQRRPLTYGGPRRRDDNHGIRACTHPAARPLLELLPACSCGQVRQSLARRLTGRAEGGAAGCPASASAGASAQARRRGARG